MSISGSKITYFGMPGRAEAARLAFVIGGVQFEDERIEFKDWGALKPNTPWGSMPFLTLSNGEQIAQSRNVLRFIGKHTNLYPLNDHLLAAKVDELLDVADDLNNKVNATGRGLEKEAKEKLRFETSQQGGAVYEYLTKLENFIAKNGANGYCVGSSLTVADLAIAAHASNVISGFYDGIPPTMLDPFPNIQAVRKTVATQEAVAAYYAANPKFNATLAAASDL
jgi:glutathione S-transferase